MHHDLISEADYERLPAEPELRFLTLESICKNNMLRLISNESPSVYDSSLRLEYMATVAAAAEELGIEGLRFPILGRDVENDMMDFSLAVRKTTPQLRLRNASKGSAHSVQLAKRTKARIKLEIQRLRDIIEASDLDVRMREALFDKLDELTEELENSRTSFAKLMAILAFIGFGVASGTSFLADAPEAIATITSLVGADKEAEAKELERLGAPAVQKALPAPEKKTGSYEFELGDEIPF